MKEGVIPILREKLGPDKVLTGPALKERYIHIWSMSTPLNALGVVLPSDTEEVSIIMKVCHQHNQPVVVHGGLTNLVGSTETTEEELVISTEKMNRIEELDPASRTITVQAGVILEVVQNAAKENDLLFPLNFGAKGTAQIGGVISTNAGGLRVFRFGMTRTMVLGLEAVLPDGSIISSLKKIIKDNSGYDLKQLFIGSEGTLGIVTRAVLKLVEAPKSRSSAFVAFDKYEKVITFLKYMDRGLAGTLSGFELIWGNAYQFMTSPPERVRPPLPHGFDYYVLLESLGSDPKKDRQQLEKLLGNALEQKHLLDAVVAHSQADLDWFWRIREDVHVFLEACPNDQQFDISLPIPLIGKVIEKITQELNQVPQVLNVFTFGHMADGNIHLIVGKSEASQELIKRVNDIVYEPLQNIGGSISAEHGIGMHKKSYLHLSRTAEEIRLMKTLKRTIDPKEILNRGKVIG